MATPRTRRARNLRQSSGLAEDRVWSLLRAGRIDGCKFRRQHPIGPYCADFACDHLKLVIEIDGGVHTREDVALSDIERQQALEALGWTMLRFTNDQALSQPELITDAIRRHSASIG
ncbi:endonuclease domain-containing protein [Brevundimonas sp.]|uniref:endonuclease domain-containing protein n=1 Tax=Brevundimonas sp. TaxID=1871086 RepID=UPI002FDA2103